MRVVYVVLVFMKMAVPDDWSDMSADEKIRWIEKNLEG